MATNCDPQVYLLAMQFATEMCGDIPESRLMHLACELQQVLEDWCAEYSREQSARRLEPKLAGYDWPV